MEKRIILYLISVLISWTVNAQELFVKQDSVNFDAIISHFKQQIPLQDSIKLPLVFKGKEYNVAISNKPIPFAIKEIVLKAPIEEKYPISFSVIYQDRLVALFAPGSFVCYSIPKMERDENFEKKLNTKKFQYHWLLNNKLIGFSKGKYYYFNSNNQWVEYSVVFPIKHQPKLYEDETYISFCDCHGEWGGTVYFYDKATKKTYFTEATCANSILKEDNKYFILSHLGHGTGSSELKEISNPTQLSQIDLKNINKTVNGEALGYTDKSNVAKKVFNYYDIQTFSSFEYQSRTLYMVYWKETTFLAEIENNTIEIVNPLFNKELYTHEPITTLYGDIILMNLDFYGIAKEQEVSCIIINDGQLIKADWNEKHDN